MNNTINKSISSLNLDKSKWVLTKLGDLAKSISERVANPAESEYERFVGLGNFVSGDWKIKTWATTENLTSSGKAFKCGDILFARRNAYLRRASMVEFDGVCSGDAFVLRENRDKVVPGFLTFVVNSNALWDYANANAAGTMSKRVKWRDLANYEFLLPPKDQQARLAELLWAMDKVVEKEKGVLERLEVSLNVQIEKRIHGINISSKTIEKVLQELSNKTKVVTLETLGAFQKGKGIPKSAVIEKGIPAIRYGELYTKHHYVIRDYYSYINEDTSQKALLLKQNDVLFAGSGETITEIGKSAAFVDAKVVYGGGDIIIFRPDNMDGGYLGYLMNSQLVRQQLNKMGTGATVMHVYASDIKKIKVPVVALKQQKQIALYLEQIFSNITTVRSKIEQSQALQKALINQIF